MRRKGAARQAGNHPRRPTVDLDEPTPGAMTNAAPSLRHNRRVWSERLKVTPRIHGRPTVFVSSAIAALRSERNAIRDAIVELDLADAWQFEWDASAAGQAPEEIYLQQARAADFFLLVVGEVGSAATEAEYEVAFADNPEKIIPFFLGPTSQDTANLRALVDARHTRLRLGSVAELPGAAASAIRDAVLSGRFLSRACRLDLNARIERLRTAAALPATVTLTLNVLIDDRPEPANTFLEGPATLLTGVGGSGKTHLALTHLAGIAAQGQHICLYVVASPEAPSVPQLIEGAFDRYRFRPGTDLTDAYGRDGLLRIVVDGIDDLRDQDRLRLLSSVEWFHDRFPRSSLALLSRSIWETRLPRAQRATMDEMRPSDINEIFAAAGYEQRNVADLIPAQLRELVGRPFWAGLIAEAGLAVDGPLDLIGKIIDRRIHVSVDGGIAHEAATRETVSALALSLHPAVEATYESALRGIVHWQADPEVAARLSPRPAEQLLATVLATGLVRNVDDRIMFLHPLLASVPASRRLAKLDTESWPPVSDELAAFAAVQLEESRRDDVVRLAAERGLFYAAQFLRLFRPGSRTGDRGADVDRYAVARRRLDGTRSGWRVSIGPSWTAIEREPDGQDSVADVADLRPADDDPQSLLIWQGDPFASATPEFLAIGDWVNDFKDRVVSLQPRQDPMRLASSDLTPLLADQERLKETVLDFVVAEGQELHRLLEEMGPTGSRLRQLARGEPVVTIYADASPPRFLVRWGGEDRSVEVASGSNEYHGRSLDAVLKGSPQSEAYAVIVRELEQRLGTTLDSHGWRVPELLSAWNL